MIADTLLELKSEVEACYGKIISITLDKKGCDALRKRTYHFPIKSTIFGIVIECAKKCPTCGKPIEKE